MRMRLSICTVIAAIACLAAMPPPAMSQIAAPATSGAVSRNAPANPGASSALDPGKWVARVWGAGSGLPGGSVRALAVTRDGFVWVGTEAGLARFDGVSFTVFDRWNSPALRDSPVLSLYTDVDGVLWVGTDGGGLCAVGPGEWRCIGEKEGLRNLHVRAIAGGGGGRLWAGTDYGVHCIDGEKIDVFGLDEGLSNTIITALSVSRSNDGHERLWAGTMWGGLARIEDGVVHLFDFKDGLGDLSVQALLAQSDGDVWIGTMRGLFRFSNNDTRIRFVPGMDECPVTALASGPDGSLLVGTMTEGLKILQGSTFADLFADDDLADGYVRSVLMTPDGFIWAGTESRGLVQLRQRTAGSITVADGLPEGSVYAVLEEGPGSLWIGTANSGLCLLRGGKVVRIIDKRRGLAGNMVRVLSKDKAGRLWVGTMDGGISIIDGARIRNLTAAGGIPSNNISEIFFDDGGGLLIGTERGLYRGRADEPQDLSPVAGLEGQAVRTLYRGGDGATYAGTRGGLWRLSGFSIEKIGGAELQAEVLSIYSDSAGTVWAGTNGGGLKCISGEGVRSFGVRDGLPGNFIFSISRHGRDSGPLWISCEAGVFTIDADSLLVCGEGGTRILAPTLYDENEGMPSSRCNGYCAPSFCVSGSGRSYYPTNGGLAIFGGDVAASGTPAAPRVIIEPLMLDNVRLVPGKSDAKNGIAFSGRADRVEIRFTALDWAAPEKCRFLYRLEGYDRDFEAVYPGQPRSAVYTGLPPGKYRFTVRAIGNTGLWSEEAATPVFAIEPPFYGRAGFVAIVLLAAAVSAGGTVALVRRRKARGQKIKYSTSSIDGERMDEACEALRALMEEEKVFLDPDLTLKKLAQRLTIHYNHLSRIINERYGESFNNYINRHRIEEAKKRLADPALADKSILEIMLETGFYSKSTFNTAFRKFTGSSPSDYRKNNT
jgi:ligand-binding sensor domain-containing protein/AraC-like DNA-binding protein